MRSSFLKCIDSFLCCLEGGGGCEKWGEYGYVNVMGSMFGVTHVAMFCLLFVNLFPVGGLLWQSR